MISINNTMSGVSGVQDKTVGKSAPSQEKKAAGFVNEGASTVVDLKSEVQSSGKNSAIKVNSSNAAGMAADIAALLAGSSGKVQANMNGFDAARLLA